MRTCLAAAVVLIATAAHAADPGCMLIPLTCSGFEPNWSFALNGTTLRFTDPENPAWQTRPLVVRACARPTPSGFKISAGAPLYLDAAVRVARCLEPSGQPRPLSISISYRQGAGGPTPRPVSGNGYCWR
jgi:hypothetical protein